MSKFVSGQVWRYNTRPGEEASRLTILKVEPDARLGNIVHVAVHGVRIQAAASPGGGCPPVGPLPDDEAALSRSVTTLEQGRAADLDLEGYHTWRRAFDEGKAGVWTLSLAEAIGAMESMLAG